MLLSKGSPIEVADRPVPPGPYSNNTVYVGVVIFKDREPQQNLSTVADPGGLVGFGRTPLITKGTKNKA